MAIDYKVIGNRIKSNRKCANLTQEELAEKLGISISYESRMERGATKISLEMLGRISDVLNIPISLLLTGTVDSMDNFLGNELSDIVKEFNSNDKKLLLDVAKAILKNKQ
ncbi:hypothetical protein B5E58_01190 [Tyzzerella sp. An114]|uniref:helix-turn-helix domain-containing protein n=1 Tax=Tyzzerella sp. An114 TaxID=1965545 RepID=UPI000B42D050|nr:helix-turn-helix transcriptional regulator [Tyzzerella sp. An114]OUQ60514.1 hypothetical protein B5E58_01190 [Tyzzerella sp. An114]